MATLAMAARRFEAPRCVVMSSCNCVHQSVVGSIPPSTTSGSHPLCAAAIAGHVCASSNNNNKRRRLSAAAAAVAAVTNTTATAPTTCSSSTTGSSHSNIGKSRGLSAHGGITGSRHLNNNPTHSDGLPIAVFSENVEVLISDGAAIQSDGCGRRFVDSSSGSGGNRFHSFSSAAAAAAAAATGAAVGGAAGAVGGIKVSDGCGRMSFGEFDDMFLTDSGASPVSIPPATAIQQLSASSSNDFVKCQPLYLSWRESEGKVPSPHWMLSIQREEIEQVRLSCMESIMKYVNKRQLSLATLHVTAHYINRLFYYYVVENGALDVAKYECLVTAAGACLRTAVKMEERLHHVDPFRSRPNHLWEDLDFDHSILPGGNAANTTRPRPWKKNVELINQMERVHIKILEREAMLNVPVAPDFLDQYLRIGGWPAASVECYRTLGQFVLTRALFLTGAYNTLTGTPPSMMAAGAVVLAVKIINSHCAEDPYEFWTKKLEHFTQYTTKDLQPVVHALSRMLRRREPPATTELLKKMFPQWASYSWC